MAKQAFFYQLSPLVTSESTISYDNEPSYKITYLTRTKRFKFWLPETDIFSENTGQNASKLKDGSYQYFYYPPPKIFGGGYRNSLCPSDLPSFLPSVRPSFRPTFLSRAYL
jgi:hypothetical protein